MSSHTHGQERWATRIGLILAMAGNAVGLGNFLRFPVQAAQNGGGTFMIPYFVSFLLLGIPLMWVEWTIGRYGGRTGHGTVPGMFDELGDRKRKWAKYLGVLGIVMPLIVFIYYTYVVSWMLGFSFFSLTGGYFGLGDFDQVAQYLYSYQDIFNTSSHGGWVAIGFFLATIVFLYWVLSRGISGGIEKLALIGMPILFLFAFVLMIRVLTLPEAAGTPAEGLNFIWNPEWTSLSDAKVWLAAAGQMFFTLSLGMGTIHTYSSYLREKDDVTLTGLSTAATNEFAEVVLGGTIAIPAAVTFFGVAGATAIAEGGSYDLGIVAMGVVFQGLPGGETWGQLTGFLWFFLLFIAGITSAVALSSPAIAFLQEEYEHTRKQAVLKVMALSVALGTLHVVFYHRQFLDVWDYWAGTFGLVIFATVEIVLFSYVFGIDRGWKEMHVGADLRVPKIYRFVIKWVTPIFLFVLLGWWLVTEAVPTLLMRDVEDAPIAYDPETIVYRWFSRIVMLGLLALGLYMIHQAWARKAIAAETEPVPPDSG
ncbi:MAG: sodium-dependent transporter [Gemmatimonadetes bacterium]|nr:sodium-dependent transporter [Gemmatimonadota bacterium]MCZ6824874.1 sodium-dependent transporter [Gemmatimonadota bacterium]